jgi:hypothetical protein
MHRNRNAVEPWPRPETPRGKEPGMESGLKQALEYLFGRLKDTQPVTHKVGDQEYAVSADGVLGAPVRALMPQWNKPTFNVGTLSALKDLYEVKVDDFPETTGLHVADHLNVSLISLAADQFGRRHVYAKATHAQETPFKFGEYMQAEEFVIKLRASFFYNDEAVKVHKLCSNLESGTSVTLGDDGISQKVEVKTGTASKAGIEIPAEGINLVPWRTFRDAAPVNSKFLLRLKTVKDSLPMVALFEIDQKWKLDTVNSIREWLRKHIKDAKIIA